MGSIFFTSDTHFNDPRLNIFNRPFKNMETMNRIIVKRWNSVVGKNDTVYHLGDFATNIEGYEYAKKLNGNIHLIVGNHDEPFLSKVKPYFKSISQNKIITIKGTPYYLTHKPIDTKAHMMNLCGHIHGLWKVANKNIINVGTDAWHFYPISENNIENQKNSIQKYYDENVFISNYFCEKNNKKTFIDDFNW